MPANALPVRYYLTHFEEMLGVVAERYGAILGDVHRRFMTDFSALPTEARCLYVRMANRKNAVFRIGELRYREITDPPAAITHLTQAAFAGDATAADREALITAMRKPELLALLGDAAKPAWTRARLAGAASALPDDALLSALPDIIVQRQAETLGYLRFLYFGRMENSLTRFALRDMGLVTPPGRRDSYAPRFESREEAESAYFYTARRAALKSADAARWADAAPEWPAAVGAQAEIARDTVLAQLGARLEQTDIAAARKIYDLGQSPECNERAVRLAYASGDTDEARARLEAMSADPGSEDEALFAADFMARKFGGARIGAVTAMLNEAPVIALDERWRAAPEPGAVRRFEAQGARAWHTENHLWRALFGLVFWAPLFETSVTHNEFERLPASLRHGDFYNSEVEAALDVLEAPERAIRAVLSTLAAHYGAPNGLFGWHEELAPLLTAFLRAAPGAAVAAILRAMARDFRQVKDGFPDLLVIEGGRVRFVEIKAEGDQLRRNQLARLGQLRRAGFEASVMRVVWTVDPAQPYVVVDVETTGGRANFHRVTEIGAVRVRNGCVEDRWSTLVNPERPIPRMITQLTGIDDAMVAGAPVFGAVADGFEAFMGDAVFVAHNARFDYGFIGAEFARLDRRFRRPTLCTCQSARALWKGLPSYGLAALCRHFDIPLTNHHRALADAEATADLLLRINAARMAVLDAKLNDTALPRSPVDA